MNKLNVDSINQDKISIVVSDITDGVNINITGDIDMRDPSEILDPFFEKIHKGCISLGVKTVELNLKQLAFLNSSGIKGIAKWIMNLSEVPVDKRYIIKIQHNKEITWQTTSLPTLKFLVPGTIQIE
jgi:hypothetical protein